MIAVDTNILARLLLRDDEAQYRKALELLGDGREYTAPPTVILELAWVLGSYDCTRDEIAAALEGLLGLPNFKPRHAIAVTTALNWYKAGMDFGDALHLAMSSGDEAFLTFDERLVKRAAKATVPLPVGLP